MPSGQPCMLQQCAPCRHRARRPAPVPCAPQINTNVYVTGLPEDVTEAELVETFSKCGVIKEDLEVGGWAVSVVGCRAGELGNGRPGLEGALVISRWAAPGLARLAGWACMGGPL